jgi:hypothetical protein
MAQWVPVPRSNQFGRGDEQARAPQATLELAAHVGELLGKGLWLSVNWQGRSAIFTGLSVLLPLLVHHLHRACGWSVRVEGLRDSAGPPGCVRCNESLMPPQRGATLNPALRYMGGYRACLEKSMEENKLNDESLSMVIELYSLKSPCKDAL